jgi:hypothetical protein
MSTFVVLAAAWLEIVVGIGFVVIPDLPCRLLFAASPEGLAIPLARFAGVALFGLGIACLPSKLAGSHWGAVLGLFVFNLGATIFFAWVAVATLFRGPLLWLVVFLHGFIAAALLPKFLTKGLPAK